MEGNWLQRVSLCLAGTGLLCWVVLFLTGTDVWHHTGRPDLWTLPGPPYQDLRAFAYAFYLLLLVLTLQVVVTVAGFRQARWSRPASAA